MRISQELPVHFENSFRVRTVYRLQYIFKSLSPYIPFFFNTKPSLDIQYMLKQRLLSPERYTRFFFVNPMMSRY